MTGHGCRPFRYSTTRRSCPPPSRLIRASSPAMWPVTVRLETGEPSVRRQKLCGRHPSLRDVRPHNVIPSAVCRLTERDFDGFSAPLTSQVWLSKLLYRCPNMLRRHALGGPEPAAAFRRRPARAAIRPSWRCVPAVCPHVRGHRARSQGFERASPLPCARLEARISCGMPALGAGARGLGPSQTGCVSRVALDCPIAMKDKVEPALHSSARRS